ncbi:MAG: hypothetical protein AAFX06_31185 [Planctomycetota bacterium]
MQIGDLFEKWGLTGLKVKTPILELDWEPADADKDAAWDLYVELLTRIATQRLPNDHGIENTALESVYSLFAITRSILKLHGRKAVGFSRIAVIVLNQIVRPFTAKWHRLSEQNAFEDKEKCDAFRAELYHLQGRLHCYTRLLADLASVEDLTDMEDEVNSNTK